MTVEITKQFATSVDTLQECWQFVMEHLEQVGDDPEIHISPVWLMDEVDPEKMTRIYEVSVRGMVEVT